MPVIHIQPAAGWGYFAKNKARLSEELVEIATNEATKTSVYMTEENGDPYLYVYRDDKKIFQSACASSYETERNLRVVYAQFIKTGSEDIVDEKTDDDCPFSELDAISDEDFSIMVREREDVISSAVFALIGVLTEDDVSESELDTLDDDCIDDIIDHIVEYLAIDCGLRIRRPMEVIDDDTGFTVRTEYPYEEYDFSKEELHG